MHHVVKYVYSLTGNNVENLLVCILGYLLILTIFSSYILWLFIITDLL